MAPEPLRRKLTLDLRRLARRGVVTALMVGTLACVVPQRALAAEPARSFFGMQGWVLPGARDLAMMKRGGVGTVRAVFDGARLASASGATWEPYDALMAAAARERIEVLPTLLGFPGAVRQVKRPRTRAERTVWAGFVRAVVTRYGHGGTFWAAQPQLEPMPLRFYQVWNEPNLPAYWRPVRDVPGYLGLVRLTRARLLAVDPKASIVLAGLPDSRLGTPSVDYLRAIYARPGARGLFDVVAVHPYAPDAPDVLAKLSRVRALMDRVGDRRTPIWVTELGWATGGLRSPYRTTELGQAARIARTFRALLAARGRLRLERVVLFGLQDRAYVATETRWWGPRVGLFDLGGHPKPAWGTFVGVTGGRAGGRLSRVG